MVYEGDSAGTPDGLGRGEDALGSGGDSGTEVGVDVGLDVGIAPTEWVALTPAAPLPEPTGAAQLTSSAMITTAFGSVLETTVDRLGRVSRVAELLGLRGRFMSRLSSEATAGALRLSMATVKVVNVAVCLVRPLAAPSALFVRGSAD